MKFGIRFRLIALALVSAIMGILIVLATLTSQHRAAVLRGKLNSVEFESFRIADEFRDALRGLNNTMQRYLSDRDPALWKEFLDSSHKLDVWIDEQKPKLTTQSEKDLLQQIDVAYDDYMRVAREMQVNMENTGQQTASLADYTPLRLQSERLFGLGRSLAKAHLESRNILLEQASHTLSELRWLVLISLGMLFLFGLALAGVVYRDMIAPLRLQLAESRMLAERHEKLASLGMLAAGVAHEIRNPLTAIKAALFIQQKKVQPGSPEHEDSKIVEREILRLERIVNDFLLFARPSEPKLEAVRAEQSLLEVQQLLAPQLARNQIELAVRNSVPHLVRIDIGQIKQVLINLVQNAADSIGKGGVIILRARAGRKHLSNGETDVVILEVADSGKGIPLEVQKRLFDPFFTTKETGTGLGLSIAAGIVQRHGGVIQYQTLVHHGTTFGIVLPRIEG